MTLDEIERITEMIAKSKDPDVIKLLKDLLAGEVQRRNMVTFPSTSTYPAKCSVCGLEHKGVMGYVCTNTACPTKVTCTLIEGNHYGF